MKIEHKIGSEYWLTLHFCSDFGGRDFNEKNL